MGISCLNQLTLYLVMPFSGSFDTIQKSNNSIKMLSHGDLNGKEVQKSGDTGVCMADLFSCAAETNTTLKSNYNKN